MPEIVPSESVVVPARHSDERRVEQAKNVIAEPGGTAHDVETHRLPVEVEEMTLDEETLVLIDDPLGRKRERPEVRPRETKHAGDRNRDRVIGREGRRRAKRFVLSPSARGQEPIRR